MNDFTKEELEELRKSVCISEQMYGHTQSRKIVRLKLNSMIDNYCEHEFCLIWCEGSNLAKCKKCGEFYR